MEAYGRKIKRWRYRKVTPKMREGMKDLRLKGATIEEVAERFKVSRSTALYHLSEHYRGKAIMRARRRFEKGVKPKRNVKHQTEYFLSRYRGDPEFRERVKEAARRSKRRRMGSGQP